MKVENSFKMERQHCQLRNRTLGLINIKQVILNDLWSLSRYISCTQCRIKGGRGGGGATGTAAQGPMILEGPPQCS